jgi:uncharacterized membrane protein YkvA (DUF1232 family)
MERRVVAEVRKIARAIAHEVEICGLILRDPRAPWLGRALLGCAVAYALSPIDLIPDFLPVVGHLDDVLIVPLLLFLGLSLVPREVVLEHRARVKSNAGGG